MEDKILYHGSKKGIFGAIQPISRQYCDFGRGFYLGTDPLQPLTLICMEKNPVVYQIKLDLKDLNVLQVPFSIEWALLIAYHKGYMEEAKGSMIYKKYETLSKGYDVIQGYIADDRMYKVMKSFFEKEITDAALFKSLSALDLGTQYVLKTQKACNQLEILKEKKLSPLELEILKDKSIERRDKGMKLTDDILKKYRREGKYFDEILGGL